MTTNLLKLNPDKTKFLLIGHERQTVKYTFPRFQSLSLEARLAHRKLLKNLDIVFDENFNFRTHINEQRLQTFLLSYPGPAHKSENI